MPTATVRLLAAIMLLGLAAADARAGAPGIILQPLGSYREETAPGSGVCRRNISEIGAYDPFTRRLFVTNYADDSLDIFDFRRPEEGPKLLKRVRMADLTGSGDLTPNSVAVRFGLVAVAAETIAPLTDPGKLLLLDLDGRLLRGFEVGSGPDMVTFTPNGRYVLAAVEGEPEPDGDPDPEGSVAILDLSLGPHRAILRTADFSRFNGQEAALREREVRITPGASAAQDLEPEFIAVSPDSRTAWVTLQENNALARVDVRATEVVEILPLGLKDHGQQGAGLDASRDDKAIAVRPWPVWGAYQPDGIAAYRVRGHDFLVTANEGDPRNGDVDVSEVGNLDLDSATYPNAADLKTRAQLGRLEVSNLPQDTRPTAAGAVTRLVSFGGRSFSIWDDAGRLVYDSGDRFERITAAATPTWFNTQDDENQFDRRSPKRGPEPEGVAIGKAFGRIYAFVGLERHSGIMVFDVTEPRSPEFQGYVNTRVFEQDPKAASNTLINCAAGDLGPEGILFIPAVLSPTFRPLLVVNHETSGSIRAFAIEPAKP